MQARQRGEAPAGPARAAVARAGGCSDGGSGREQGLRCRALVVAATVTVWQCRARLGGGAGAAMAQGTDGGSGLLEF